MSRVRSPLVLAVVFVVGGVLLAAAAQAAEGRAPGVRRGFGMFAGRGSLLGLLRLKQVQNELKLNEEQAGKVAEVSKKLMGEMRKQSAALREITDPKQRREKRTELSEQLDRKAREQLRGVLSREQVMRLYQIRIQIRGAVYALNNKWIASRLKLTDEQRKKVAEIAQSAEQKQRELYAGLRNLSQEERRAKGAELRKKRNNIRQKANEEALGLLTAEQKEGFKKMQGEKFELRMRRPRA